MRKLIFILFVLAPLVGCRCLLSQVPPQIIFVDENCQGRIPDYTQVVLASDNCGGVVLTQLPAPNTLLTVNNPTAVVTVTGTDNFGNTSQILINVTLVDTIPPILSWPIGQVAMGEEGMINLYKNWEAAVKVYGIAQWVYDQTWTQGLPLDSMNMREGLMHFTNIIKLTDEEYDQYVKIMENK